MMARRWTAPVLIAGLALAAALAGCGASPSTAQAPTETPYPTYAFPPTPAPTQPPSPTADPNGPGHPRPCSRSSGAASPGDLTLSAPTALYGFNADYLLPSGLPATKPLAITVQQGLSYITPGQPIENGTLVGTAAAFVVTICNTSGSRSHTLTTFGVKLASATPYSGSVNALNGCAFLYSRPTGFGGECASGYSPDLQLTFLASTSATPVTQASPAPVALAPGYGLDVSFGINPPSSQEIATYHLGVGIDGAPVAFPSGQTTQPWLNATVGLRWAGDYCSTAQMQAQIPASIPSGSYYVCPQG